MIKKIFNKMFLKKMNSEKGSVLILTLIVSCVFMVLGAGQLVSLVSEARQMEKAYLSDLAVNVAEAGVDEAIWELNYDGGDFSQEDGWTDIDPVTKTVTKTAVISDVNAVPVGTYNVSIVDPTGIDPVIQSQATTLYQSIVAAESRTVEVGLESGSESTYMMAAFAENNIEMNSNACTKSFDSRLGPYNRRTNVGSEGDVGTNSTSGDAVHLDSNADVEGDAFVGSGGDPVSGITTESNATISGAEAALPEAVEIPSITAPTGLTSRGSLNIGGNTSVSLSQSGQYENISFDSNSSLTIDGNVTLYVTGTFSMNSNVDLVITEGSEVEIYVDGSISFSSNTDVNNETHDPSKLKIFGTDNLTNNGSTPGIQLNSNTDIYAIIHAKNSDVSLDSNAEVFGSVMADNVFINSNSCIYYDVALADATSSGEGDYTVATWQEK